MGIYLSKVFQNDINQIAYQYLYSKTIRRELFLNQFTFYLVYTLEVSFSKEATLCQVFFAYSYYFATLINNINYFHFI